MLNNSAFEASSTISNSISNISSFINKNGTDKDDNLFWTLSNAYRPFHGYLSTAVCLFGIPSNLLNIIVLTRPNMVIIELN